MRAACPASPLGATPSNRRRTPEPKALSSTLGVLGSVTLVPLVAWEVWPRWFPATAHAVVAAIPLAAIALLYLLHQRLQRAGRAQIARAALVALAFLFWAANQLWWDRPSATLFNDIAIAAFVVDLVLGMIQRPSTRPADRGRPASVAEAGLMEGP